MQYLDLHLDQPTWMQHPMQKFTREHDVVRREELQAFTVDHDEGLQNVLFYVEADREPYERRLADVDCIQSYDLTPVTDESFFLYVREDRRPEDEAWQSALAARNLVVVLPIVYDSDAAFSLTVVGESDDLQAMLDDLPDVIDVRVDAIGEYDRRHAPVAGGLTDRQFEALEVAVREGFYGYPRNTSIGDVAAALDCAESTATVLLQRAEASVMERLVRRHGRSP